MLSQDLKAFPYLNLTTSQVVDWFSDSIKSKFKTSSSERIELDPTSLSSGKAKKSYETLHLISALIRSLQDVPDLQARSDRAHQLSFTQYALWRVQRSMDDRQQMRSVQVFLE
jgi:hypothetical protein